MSDDERGWAWDGASRLTALALVLAAVALPAKAGERQAEVKASYLYKFAPYVTWPAEAGPAGRQFIICIVGADPFGRSLEHATAGQSANGRPIVLRRLAAVDHGTDCDVAFLGGAPGQSVRDAMRALHGAPVLTVTDGGVDPGVIDFIVDEGRVRFRIDDQAAADDGLVISSKLLGLAVTANPRKSLGLKR